MGSGGKRTRDEEHEGKEGCLNKGWNGGRYEIFPNFPKFFIYFYSRFPICNCRSSNQGKLVI